jgi:hypothetical protein
MRREKQESWTWIPAETRVQAGGRATGALVLAIACLSIGIVIGRVSISTQDDNSAEHVRTPAQVHIPAPEASSELSESSEPAPSAAETEAPTLPLGNEPRDKQIANVSPAPSDTPVLLNPGTSGPPRTLEEDRRPTRWKRALVKRKWNSPSGGSVARRSPGSSRDYQALRQYVLGK